MKDFIIPIKLISTMVLTALIYVIVFRAMVRIEVSAICAFILIFFPKLLLEAIKGILSCIILFFEFSLNIIGVTLRVIGNIFK